MKITTINNVTTYCTVLKTSLFLYYSILKMKVTGIMACFYSRYWPTTLEEKSEPKFEVPLKAAIPVFMVFAFGAGISVFLLVMELCIYKIFHRQ
jgi:hypothetical protein